MDVCRSTPDMCCNYPHTHTLMNAYGCTSHVVRFWLHYMVQHCTRQVVAVSKYLRFFPPKTNGHWWWWCWCGSSKKKSKLFCYVIAFESVVSGRVRRMRSCDHHHRQQYRSTCCVAQRNAHPVGSERTVLAALCCLCWSLREQCAAFFIASESDVSISRAVRTVSGKKNGVVLCSPSVEIDTFQTRHTNDDVDDDDDCDVLRATIEPINQNHKFHCHCHCVLCHRFKTDKSLAYSNARASLLTLVFCLGCALSNLPATRTKTSNSSSNFAYVRVNTFDVFCVCVSTFVLRSRFVTILCYSRNEKPRKRQTRREL